MHAQNGHISASNLRTFSVVFIGKATSPPHFYFRFIWPTDLESVPRFEPPTLIISIKFEVDTTIHRRVTALLVRIRYVALCPWPFNLGQLSSMAGHVGNPPPSLKILRLSVLDLWVMMSAIGHRWQCVCSHCACAVSRDLYIGGKFFLNLKSLTPICLFTTQLLWSYDDD